MIAPALQVHIKLQSHHHQVEDMTTVVGKRLLKTCLIDSLEFQIKEPNSKRKYELVNTLTNTVPKRGGDTVTAYLIISDTTSCNYSYGSKSYRIAKGISPCPMNIEIPVGSGVFDSNQMNYSSPSSLKTTWYLDSSSTYNCTYKYGTSKRTIPKGTSSMCPLSYDF